MNQRVVGTGKAIVSIIVLAVVAGCAVQNPEESIASAKPSKQLRQTRIQSYPQHAIPVPMGLSVATYIPDIIKAEPEAAPEKPEDAQKRYEAMLASDPRNVSALLGLAQLRERAGAAAEAAALIEKAVAAKPTDPAPRVALVDHYLRNKDPKKAAARAQEALTAIPDDPNIVDALGRAQLAVGANNQAVATYAKLAKLRPESPLTWFRVAQADAAANDKAAAAEHLRKALAIKPDFLEAQRGLASLEFQAGHVKEAIAIARDIQKQRPKESAGYLLEGDLNAYGKKWGAAATAYRTGLNQTATTDLAMKLYAALDTGGDPNAEKMAAGWLKEHPKDETFRLFMAGNATDKRNYAAAVAQYRAVLEVHPNNPALLNNLAWVAALARDPQAIEYAEKAHSLAPNEVHIMDTLGMILVDRGDTTRGIEMLRKALATSPDLTSARLNLAKAFIKTGRKDDARKELEVLTKLGDAFPRQNEVTALMKSL